MNAAIQSLADSIFERDRRAIHARTDRMFVGLMAFQYALAVVLALVVSPLTWAGAVASLHPHVWTAVLLGGVLAAYPVFLALRQPGATSTRHLVAVSQALFSALLIHLTSGRVETHFHIFVSLAFLVFYRDWRVLVTFTLVTLADHVLRGALVPASIYGTDLNVSWRFLEHAAWIVFEDAFLVGACCRLVREMRETAAREAELQIVKERLERDSVALERQSAIFNAVLSSMSDGVIVVGASGEILLVNPAAQVINGLGSANRSFAEWPKLFDLAVDGVSMPGSETPLARAMRGEAVDQNDVRFCRLTEGDQTWLDIVARPLVNEASERLGGMVVFRDVSHRKETLEAMARARDEAERANLAKSEFLSRMSHELRTPMNAILGFGQVLAMDEQTEDQRDSLDQILFAGRHLLGLINDILDIAGIEAGRTSISKEAVDAARIVREVASMVQTLGRERGVAVHIDLPEGPFPVVADPHRLLQVVLNLVSNAIKYNVVDGEVRVTVEREEGLARIVVSDTGRGIPPEKADLLFNPFERLGAENTGVPGTGLGLSLSKSLVEGMGGHLALRPTKKGACFCVELAVACERPLLEEAILALTAEGSLSGEGGKTILLIEDNPSNVRLVERVLHARPKYSLTVAVTGQAGLDAVDLQVPDLVLLDLDLPDMHGREVLRKLKENPATFATPVIIVSADASPSHFRRLIGDGASDYVTKPIDVPGFLSLIDERCPLTEARVA